MLQKIVPAVAFIIGCATLPLLAGPPAPANAKTAAEKSAASPLALLPRPAAQPPAWIAFERTWEKITAYSATVTTFEQKGGEAQNWVFDYTFRKPSSATVHYNVGPHAGVTVLWDGGTTVAAHKGKGLISFFKRTFSLHDPQVMSIRGSSVDELSFAAIISHAQNMPGTLSQGRGPTILGIPTEAITLTPVSSAADTGLTHEVIDISLLTSLPLRVLGYDGQTLVRQVDFSDITLQR